MVLSDARILRGRPMRSRLTLPLALAALAAVAVGCAEPPPEPSDGDALPERMVTRADIMESYAQEGDHLVSPVLDAPAGATRVGMLLTVPDEQDELDGARIEARGIGDEGEPGEWREVDVTWSEGGQVVARADLGGTFYGAQIRIREGEVDRIVDVMWSAVVPALELEASAEPTDGETDGEIAASTQPLRGELSDLVHSRGEWGARGTRCSSSDPDKYRMAIHHTVTPSGGDIPSRLRGIQSYHMDTRGWCDIGYHFLVSKDGRLWEGRPLNLRGAHVGGHNTGNIGISFIGCFHTSGCSSYTPYTPPDGMVDAAGSLVGRLADLYGIGVDASSVKGHRDHSGQTTSCPGDNLHAQLGDIRAGGSEPPALRAEYVNQTFPLAREPFEIEAGSEAEGHIEMRNTGSATWHPGEVFLGTTEPRDVESPIAGSDWVSPRRAATVDRVVAPGETGKFIFSVRAPDALGDYPQFFNLVQEGVAWFSDPGQGGPPDNQLQVRVTSVEPTGPTDPGPDSGTTADPPQEPARIANTSIAQPMPTYGASTSGGVTRPGEEALGGGCSATGRTGGGAAMAGLPLVLLLLTIWGRGRSSRTPARSRNR